MQDEPSQKSEDFSNLLSQFRDQVMKSSPKGDVYIESAYKYAPEIMVLLMQNESLRVQAKELASEVQPLLESVLSDEAETYKPRIEKAWVERVDVLLIAVKEQVSPALRAEIEWWQAYLSYFAGKTGKEIWDMLPER